MAGRINILKYTDDLIEKRVITSRSKNFIISHEIDSLEELERIIDEENEILKTPGYGLKTLYDLKIIYHHIREVAEKVIIVRQNTDDLNLKTLVIDSWEYVVNQLDKNEKFLLVDIFRNDFEINNPFNFHELYEKIHQNKFEVLNIYSDKINFIFLKLLFIYYSFINDKDSLFTYDILYELSLFNSFCEKEFYKISKRAQNILSNTYTDRNNKNPIDFKSLLIENKNHSVSEKAPNYRGLSGVAINSMIENIKNYLDVMFKEDYFINSINYNLTAIVNIENIDEIFIYEANNNKLRIEIFIIKYFDNIFSFLGRTPIICIKSFLKFNLPQSKIDILSKYSNERIRQIYVRKFSIFIDHLRHILDKLSEYSPDNYKLNEDYKIVLKNEILQSIIIKNDLDTFYEIYKLLVLCSNKDYYVDSILMYERPKKIFEIDDCIFINSKIISKDKFRQIFSLIEKVSNSKYETRYNLNDLFNAEDLQNESIKKLIYQLISYNKLLNSIQFDGDYIMNTKLPKLESMIEKCMLFYKSLTTIDMIRIYLKETYGIDSISNENIRITITKNKEKFFHLGKTGKYGLQNQLYNQHYADNIQGFKSIKELISNVLNRENRPIHLNEIIKILLTQYNSLNVLSLDRLIRDTPDFCSIGQSFFILKGSQFKYDLPVNHRKINSILIQLDIQYNLKTNWVNKELLDNYMAQNNVPGYQIEYLYTSDLFLYGNKATIAFNKYILGDIVQILEDQNLSRVIKEVYRGSTIVNKIQIRKNIKRFIQTEYHITILEEDIQKLINFHIV